MDYREFAELLGVGHETRGVEYKGPGLRTDRHFLALVARAALGMANRREGGKVILGVDDNRGVLNPVGLSDEQLATWRRYDTVAASLLEYADPSLGFDLETLTAEERRYVILSVHEFEEIPVLCARSYPSVLRRGACYVRTRGKPETSEVPSQEDMRALIEWRPTKESRGGSPAPMPPASSIWLRVLQFHRTRSASVNRPES